jgi:hypothetical protein
MLKNLLNIRVHLISAALVTAALCWTPAVLTSSAEAAKLAPCQRDYEYKWKKLRKYKAVATTAGKSLGAKGISCGFSYGKKTKASAIREALRSCQRGSRNRCKVIYLQ